MKKITLLLSLLITSVGFSQEILQDFETAGLGDAFGGSSAELVADPQSGGTRGQVAKLTSSTSAGAQIWQGINISLEKNVQLTTNKTMKIDVYSTSAISIAPKVIGGLDGAPDSTAAVSHMGTGWETLTITFNQGLDGTTTANGVYGAFVVYYLWDTTANGFINPVIDRTFYVDNIEGIGVAPVVVTGPTTYAPTPTHPAADVISIYSDAYTNINVTNFNPGWGQSGAVNAAYDPTGNGTNTELAYTNFNYQGTEFDAQDASAMENLHVDVWTDTAGAVLKVTPINNSTGGTGSTEQLVDVTVVNAGWSSVNLAKSSFAGMTWDNVYQLKFDGQSGTNPSNVYVDNVYFWKAPTAGIDDHSLGAVRMYPNPANGVVKFTTISKDALEVSIYDLLGKEVMPLQNVQTELNISSLTTGMYFIKMSQAGSSVTKKLLVN